ncbi:hypothetical protein FEM48_Zijuj04G0038400 [Ziziphus jujuba var. spinosa]|uniref:LOB domain-containing protein n=1 Tax=Ziziphus jujuba var. spinosa TaxID=714518 RepID=A0A978VHM9_ZIZJJ|nr:hypothetical protein FEM48_Zijuj04G0038400 [Ziziphus jujuba var. spinosa]
MKLKSSFSPPPLPFSSSINNYFSNLSFLILLIYILILCPFSPIMTIKGGTSQACAACKYQRRRCSKECALAPYFPAEKAKEFQNAHRLFGVRNIMNILKQVPPQHKEDAMTSIIFESDMRAQYPVRGCMGIISQLHLQLQQSIEELRLVQTKLAICKEQCQYQVPLSPSNFLPQLHLGMNSKNDALPIHHHPQYNCVGGEMAIEFLGNNGIATTTSMTNTMMNGIYIEAEDNNMVKPLRNQSPYYCIDSIQQNNNLFASSQQGYPIQQELDVSHYDDIPFDTIADDRQSYIEFKEACESSAESALKDNTQIMEHVSQTELKNAAACFSLTSVK